MPNIPVKIPKQGGTVSHDWGLVTWEVCFKSARATSNRTVEIRSVLTTDFPLCDFEVEIQRSVCHRKVKSELQVGQYSGKNCQKPVTPLATTLYWSLVFQPDLMATFQTADIRFSYRLFIAWFPCPNECTIVLGTKKWTPNFKLVNIPVRIPKQGDIIVGHDWGVVTWGVTNKSDRATVCFLWILLLNFPDWNARQYVTVSNVEIITTMTMDQKWLCESLAILSAPYPPAFVEQLRNPLFFWFFAFEFRYTLNERLENCCEEWTWNSGMSILGLESCKHSFSQRDPAQQKDSHCHCSLDLLWLFLDLLWTVTRKMFRRIISSQIEFEIWIWLNKEG